MTARKLLVLSAAWWFIGLFMLLILEWSVDPPPVVAAGAYALIGVPVGYALNSWLAISAPVVILGVVGLALLVTTLGNGGKGDPQVEVGVPTVVFPIAGAAAVAVGVLARRWSFSASGRPG